MNDKKPMSREEEVLKSIVQQVNPNPSFTNELEKKLMNAHKPEKPGFFSFVKIASAAGWTVALAALILTFIWVIRSIAPQPQPAAGNTPLPTIPSPTPEERGETPKPAGKEYPYNGQTLYLQDSLPVVPTEASLYDYQIEQHVTLESARAFAAQFGMNGAVYRVPGETATPTRVFLVVDGNQWLRVRSDQYFQYYPDYPGYAAAINGGTPPANAEALIEDFLQSHGFDFPHSIQPSEVYGGYVAAPLTPDGHILCYEYFKCAGLHFQLNEQGILYVDGSLPKYESIGQYGIINAEEALQKFLNSNGDAGTMMGMHSFSPPVPTWLRERPLDQPLMLYGYLASVPSAEGGQPLVTLDGILVTGNIENVPPEYDNTFVEATGQLREQDGVKAFVLQSWTIFSNGEEGLIGAISQQNGQVILNTAEGESLTLPIIPADLPLPLDNAFVIGVRAGETFEWKSIDQRMLYGGGGGGGGGLGFYKLNLTGAPVPFPTPEPQMLGGGGGGGGQTYVVQDGDTLAKIADQFEVGVAALMQANGLSEATIFIGQTLVVPSTSTPQKIEGVRGLMSITIYKQADGSQRIDYVFVTNTAPYSYLLLEGEDLEALQNYQNKPVDVWGTMETTPEGQPILKVERYEIPFPDLQFQILRGTQTPVTLDGQPATLFTAEDSKTYVQFNPGGGVDGSTVGNLDDVILIEALAIPDETFGSYPVVRMFSATTAINLTDGKEAELSVSADQIYIVELAAEGEYIPPTMSIERIELVYYMPDPRYQVGELIPDQRYIQPAWLFAGHYSTGEEFFILVQALKQEFLLPEPAPYTQPG
jgi:hypothetical protein